jgi:hypothetical protein
VFAGQKVGVTENPISDLRRAAGDKDELSP